MFGFLQNSKYNFGQELEALSQELPVQVYLDADFEDELQTDGSRASRSFYHGRIQPGRPRPCSLLLGIWCPLGPWRVKPQMRDKYAMQAEVECGVYEKRVQGREERDREEEACLPLQKTCGKSESKWGLSLKGTFASACSQGTACLEQRGEVWHTVPGSQRAGPRCASILTLLPSFLLKGEELGMAG